MDSLQKELKLQSKLVAICANPSWEDVQSKV